MSDSMDFGGAIEALREGKKLSRKGWNGEEMCIYLVKGKLDISIEKNAPIDGPDIANVKRKLFEPGEVGNRTRMPYICMRTASGEIVDGWVASQTDIFAEDWEIIASEK